MQMQYKIVSGMSGDELIKKVNDELKAGWKPAGGLCSAIGPKGALVLSQALTIGGTTSA